MPGHSKSTWITGTRNATVGINNFYLRGIFNRKFFQEMTMDLMESDPPISFSQ
jgi:hypothetical protein